MPEMMQTYFDGLTDTEFEQLFAELAHTSAFSRIASGAQQPTDYIELQNSLQASPVPTQFYATQSAVETLVHLVTYRIMRIMGR